LLESFRKNIIAKKNFDVIFTPLLTAAIPQNRGASANGGSGLPMTSGALATRCIEVQE
jgi:hypothetical protein